METAVEFYQASRCLDAIVMHCGEVWDVTASAITEGLERFNAAGRQEMGAGWRDIILYDLRAASRQRIAEMEAQDYGSVTTTYREERFMGRVIQEAIAGAEEPERLARLDGEAAEGIKVKNSAHQQSM